MKEARLHFSEPLLREAVRIFVMRSLRRGLGWRFLVACAALVFCVAYLVLQGDRSWVMGVLAAALVFPGIFLATIYLAHLRNTVGRFRQMRVPEATLAYDEEKFTFTSDLGSATMPWSAIREVWRYPKFWLILYSPSQFSTLPLDDLDEETRTFITRKTEAQR